MTRVLAAPGNAGIAASAECFPSVAADDVDTLVNLVDQQDVDLTVVGPEVPLVAGLADELRKRGRNVFGPSAAAARIEGSKAFAKDVMERRGVPTARAGVFDDPEKATAFVDELGGMAVVKADGLAAGKGVTVATDREDRGRGDRGEPGRRRVRRGRPHARGRGAARRPRGERVRGDRRQGELRAPRRRPGRKRIGDGDTGPNTGGMGAYSPVPCARRPRRRPEILDRVLAPVVDELRPYRGVLYAGLMLTADGPEGARVQLPVRRPRDPGRCVPRMPVRRGRPCCMPAPPGVSPSRPATPGSTRVPR